MAKFPIWICSFGLFGQYTSYTHTEIHGEMVEWPNFRNRFAVLDRLGSQNSMRKNFNLAKVLRSGRPL